MKTNRLWSLVSQGLLGAGMIYGLITASAIPAAACTPTQCSTIDHQNTLNGICAGEYGSACAHGGQFYCDSTGYSFGCYTQDGLFCGSTGGTC